MTYRKRKQRIFDIPDHWDIIAEHEQRIKDDYSAKYIKELEEKYGGKQ